jgi:putative toxin-antitoxin system antitoxin component (TIGR02293 family)
MSAVATKTKSKTAASRAVTQREIQHTAKSKLSGTGVVKFCIKGAAASPDTNQFTPSMLVALLQAGLPFRELQDLQASLAIPTEKLAPMLGISKATFHRRKGDTCKLPTSVSDRVVRYARILGQALQVFEDLDAAKKWLNAPQFGLGGVVPLEYAKTEFGAREVENLLGRIEYGVYS